MLVVLQQPMYNGSVCPLERTEMEECDTNVFCPGLQLHDLLISFSVNCVVDDWGDWGLCSKSCGGGLMGQRKEVLVVPKYGGAECPSNITNVKYCGEEHCPKGRKEILVDLTLSMAEDDFQPEVLWGSSKDERFTAENVLSDEIDFKNSTHANYWLAKKGKIEGEGFVVRVGTFKQKFVGVEMKNILKSNNPYQATKTFHILGSLLKEPETSSRRAEDFDMIWTSDVLLDAGSWDVLLANEKLEARSQLQRFYFEATTELRFLWFHLHSFYGEGGGLQYFAPIYQSGRR